jgi:putative transposase
MDRQTYLMLLKDYARAAYVGHVLAEQEETDELIRTVTRTGRPFGSEGFIDRLEFSLGQSLRVRKAGRPRRK